METFFTVDGRLDARLDIIDEETDFLNRPLRIYYGIEPRCNLSCSYCGPRNFYDKDLKTSVEREDFLLKQFYEANVFQVQLTGGEIGIRGYDLVETVKKTNDFGFAVILSTSGVWKCIEDKRHFVGELAKIGNIVQVKVSIEGTPEYHDSLRGKGTHRQLVDTLEVLADYGFTPRLNQTLFKESCRDEHLDYLVRLAERFEGGLQLIPLRPIGNARSLTDKMPSIQQLYRYSKYAVQLRNQTGIPIKINFDFLDPDRKQPDDLIDYRQRYDLRSPSSCGAPFIGLHIDHKGQIYPCGFVQDVPEFVAGTITPETPLLDIWRNSEILNRVRRAGKSDECNTCSYYRKGCGGGCWVMGWIFDGVLNGKDPYCYKELVNIQ
jgi:radical SAM protein with 4Fe4S-binding SPASM domain